MFNHKPYNNQKPKQKNPKYSPTKKKKPHNNKTTKSWHKTEQNQKPQTKPQFYIELES